MDYNLTRIRAVSGLTLEEIAETCGVSVGALSMIERGVRPVTADFARRVSPGYGLDPINFTVTTIPDARSDQVALRSVMTMFELLKGPDVPEEYQEIVEETDLDAQLVRVAGVLGEARSRRPEAVPVG